MTHADATTAERRISAAIRQLEKMAPRSADLRAYSLAMNDLRHARLMVAGEVSQRRPRKST